MHDALPSELFSGLSKGTVASFVLFALSSSASPGPNNLLIMAVAARSGLKRTLPCIAAITTAFGAMLVIGALTGGTLLERVPNLVRLLGAFGALWMLYLAWTIGRSDPRLRHADTLALPHWSKAVLLCWSNPKAWMMALTTGTTYLPHGPSWKMTFCGLIGIKLLIGLVAQLGWAAIGLSLYRPGTQPHHLIAINRLMGVLLAVSALAVLF
ncbi:LysE family translocator [Asaia astilbis]|uniref:LysE family translocator n=1 Tax=Asaia astilbis TaxID=610244 RepID=UPI000471D108|nr:LysE family translocator [Asaia astilbis]